MVNGLYTQRKLEESTLPRIVSLDVSHEVVVLGIECSPSLYSSIVITYKTLGTLSLSSYSRLFLQVCELLDVQWLDNGCK